VLAQSFERIHRSNLIGMGVLPLELPEGESVTSLGLSGHETFSLRGLTGRAGRDLIGATIAVTADGTTFEARARIDTPMEAVYFGHGGILRYVVRHLAQRT
jgi:aconitate hydratase